MKFLVDVQLPGTLVRWLRDRNHDAVHVLERNLGQVDDGALWRIAKEEGRIMISKDEDFFILATRLNDEGCLLWLRMGNCRTNELLNLMNQRWNNVIHAFEEGQRIVEVY